MTSNQLPITNYQLPNGFIAAGVSLEFSYAAGETASRFLVALRDEQKIFGTRCPACARVLVPARSFCPRCSVETTDWVEVGPAGALVAFALIERAASHHPRPAPFAYGLIRLDGADVNFVHLIGGAPLDSLAVGMRVAPVFATARVGSILDIAYFKPVETSRAHSI